MNTSVSDALSGRAGLAWARSLWRALRRFFERRSAYSIAAGILAIAGLMFGLQQWQLIQARQTILVERSVQLDQAIAAANATLQHNAGTPTATPVPRPKLSEHSQIAAHLQKLLQHKDVNTTDIGFAPPVLDTEKTAWQQDTTVKLSGPYVAVSDLLIGIPRSLGNVALISVVLTREAVTRESITKETNEPGQVTGEAVLRAYYSVNQDSHAAQ